MRSTLALRDWLVALRPAGLAWRAPVLEPEEGIPELDAQVAALHAFGPDTPEHLLGDLLGYWLRERRANTAPKLAKTALDTPALLEDPDVIAGLSYQGQVRAHRQEGQAAQVGRCPLPMAGPDRRPSTSSLARGPSVLYSTPDGADRIRRPSITSTRRTRDRAHLERAGSGLGCHPLGDRHRRLGAAEAETGGARPSWLPRCSTPRLRALRTASSLALLRRDLPRFSRGGGPPGGAFTDDVESITSGSGHLDHSYVAIQGPPGTGKTYRGAHIVHQLDQCRQRVGITAMSHTPSTTSWTKSWSVFDEEGDLDKLHCIRKGDEPDGRRSAGGGVHHRPTSRVPAPSSIWWPGPPGCSRART